MRLNQTRTSTFEQIVLPEPVDTLYRAATDKDSVFTFDERVAAVFPDMIQRSVPGYLLTLSTLGLLAAHYAKTGSNIYDLGCALGAATMAIHPHIQGKRCTINAIDNAPAMLAHCKKNLEHNHITGVKLYCADIRQTKLQHASFVVLNYTLQFIPVTERKTLLERIYAGMLPGAMLVLSEKIIESNDKEQQLVTRLHELFKKQNGYSALEIYRKRQALERALFPETSAAHIARLAAVGFQNSIIGLKSLNFVSIFAIKPGATV